METIFDAYSYIYFSLTKFRNDNISSGNSEFSAVGLMTIVIFLYCAIFVSIIWEIYNISLIPISYLENKPLVFLIATGILFIHWVMFFKITNYKKLEVIYDETNRRFKRRDYFVMFYIISPFLFTFLSLLYLVNR